MDTVRLSQRRAAVLLGLLALVGAPALTACGGARTGGPESAPPARPRERLDVFHDVYFRGSAAPPGTPARVALTATGLGACTAPFLARLHGLPDARDIPVIALSAYTSPDDVEHARRAGFVAHVAKPARFDVLARTITSAVRRRDEPPRALT